MAKGLCAELAEVVSIDAHQHLPAEADYLASVLAGRIEAGDFDPGCALHLARLWLHDNPAWVYRLA